MKLVTEDQITDLVNRIKDKFIKKDTGWYDITALVAMPANTTYLNKSAKVLLRRIANTVYLAFSFFAWSVPSTSTNNWLPPDICAYVAPPKLPDGYIMRMAGILSGDNRTILSHYYNWLSATDFKLLQNGTLMTHALTSWVTDTPFPTSPKGVKI